MSLPSRTAAIIPHPHEQKLHEVVNSLTSESFISRAAAFIAGQSTSPASGNPDAPPTDSFRNARRLTPASSERPSMRLLPWGFGGVADPTARTRAEGARRSADLRLHRDREGVLAPRHDEGELRRILVV